MVNQYLPFAFDSGANVLDPTDYDTLPAREDGFQPGLAESQQANTPWRQATVGVSAVAQFAADYSGEDLLDNGDRDDFQAKFELAMTAYVNAAIDAAGAYASGGIFGMITSNTPSFETTRISISVGKCRDSTNTANINLVAPISKRLDVAWVAGNNNGGRDTGSLAAGQTWHVFVILNPTTSAVDALFSQSPTAPTLPSGYTKFRRVGAVLLDAASTAIRLYVQTGDWFMLKLRSTDYAVQSNGGGVPYLRQISVPAGIRVLAKCYFQSTGSVPASAGSAFLSGVFDPAFGAPPAFGASTQWAQVRRQGLRASDGSDTSYGTVVLEQFTDTNKNVYTFSSDPLDVIALGVLGWNDERGRFY